MTDKTVSEATAELAAAATAQADVTVAAVVADAAAQVAAAQEGAQAIVEAAMQAPLAQRVAELETENEEAEEWESQVERQLAELATAVQSLLTKSEALQASLTVLQTPPAPPTIPLSSIPANLAAEVIQEAAQIVDPNSPQSVAVDALPAPGPSAARKRLRLI
jgi:hypothetical protein